MKTPTIAIPTSPSPRFEGKSKLGLYGDFVAETDDTMGRLLRALKKHGLAENTLVLATSDHGPASYAGNIRKATSGQIHDLEKMGHYSGGIYRGFKFTVFEGGLRVPLLVRWPGTVEAGSRCDRMVGLNDLAATIADVVGINLANNAPDSISFLPLLKDPTSKATRKTMVMQSPWAFVVRHENWKLALTPSSGSAGRWGTKPIPEQAWGDALRSFDRKPTDADLRRAPFVQLYDLDTDIRETNNVAAVNPNVVAQISDILDEQIVNGRSTPGPELQNDVAHVPVHRNALAWIEQAP